MKKELILVLDFGGQYNQLIARRVRECNVYCEVHPYNLSIEKIREMNPKGIILLADLIAYMVKTLHYVIKKYLILGYQCWEYAMDHS